jgi:DNA-binding NarL/FixJ family response regulator
MPSRSPFGWSTCPNARGTVRPDPTWGDEDADLTTAGEPEIDPGPIRLVLVEPSSIHGAAVRELLDREDDFEVVAEVRTTDEAVSVTMAQPPDVLVVDVDLPDPDAVEATRRLKRQAPEAGLVIIARDDDDDAVFRAVQAGATAHVADHEGPDELVDAIRRVADGEDPLAATVSERPAVAQRVADAYRDLAVRGVGRSDSGGAVSPRQLEILRLVAKGHSNEEIAQLLNISRQTVKNHLTAAMRALGARRRGQAVAAAMRAGWLSMP